MTNLELLDKLAERIGNIRAETITDLAMTPQRKTKIFNFTYGQDRGLYLALLEIADLKREIETGEKPGT